MKSVMSVGWATVSVVTMLASAGSATSVAQAAASPESGATSVEAVATSGILPIPDYTGDIWSRPMLLGDLGGARTHLANRGVQFGIDWNNSVQSVVDGGRDSKTAYGGTLDYNLVLDLMRMGLVPGALIKMRAESRYGESVNGDTGSFLPANLDFFMPLDEGLDSGVPILLTTLSYTQFLSESFGVFAGKFDTLDGDGNEFASGRGLTQFQNLNLVFNSAPLLTVPYSTLGGGLFWRPAPNITLSSSVFTTSDASTTSGFDNIGDGWTWASELAVQYRIGALPGGFNVGGSFAWDNDFVKIGRRFVFQPGEGVTLTPTSDTSWAMYASVWQYLFAEEPAEGADAPLNTQDGKPDRKGFGLFARVGFADSETNPVELAISAGVGGRGIIPNRDDDMYGVGYFRNENRLERLTTLLGAKDAAQGVEAFYNIAVTPATGLTLSMQVVEPSRDVLDTAFVLGARLLVRF